MKKLFGVVAIVCLALCAHAQNWTTVSASNLTDLNQQKLAAGTLCFLITDLNDQPISVMIGGGGQSLQRPYCSVVTNGAAASFTVPNPANTAPANIAYRVTGTDSSSGQIVLRYKVVQFTGATFNLDTYVPGFNLPLGVSASILSVGNLSVTGSCSYAGITGCGGGGGSGPTLETGGTNNTSQAVLNFQNGATIDGIQVQPSNPSSGNEQMAISGTLTVPGGGTGLGTLTAHELYVGNGTSNPNAVGTGTAGQVLISGGSSADPSFADPVISYNNPSETTAAWTSSTSLNTALTVTLPVGTGVLSSVIVTLNQGSTITAGQVTFNVSDTTGFTNPYPIACRQVNAGALANQYMLQASTNSAFVCNVSSFEAFQVKLTTAITGSGTVNVGIQPTSAPVQDGLAITNTPSVTVSGTPSVSISGTPTVNAAESGTWTVQPGNTANTTPWLTTINQGGNSATVTASNALKVDGSAVTQPVSGTVTANAGTGTFNIQSNASVNVNQVAGSAASTAAAGTQLVGVADGAGNKITTNSSTYTSKFALDVNLLGSDGTAFGTAGIVDQNLKQVGGSAVSTAATGVQKVGVVGNAGTALDSAAGTSNGQAITVQGNASGVAVPVSGTVTANQGGTWTVQPGNTANTTPWLVQGSLSSNGAAAGTNRIGTLDGIAQTDYNNGTASTQGRDVAPNVGTDGLLWTAALPAMRPASYHANANFAASSTTDNAVLPGNASNTVLVTKVTVSCTQTTAGIVLMKIIKRSTADTSGTSASMTAVADDSNYSAASSAPLSYTGTGPTAGTAVGNIDTYYLGCLASGTATPNDIYVLNLRQKPIVLRGTAQQLAVNFNNSALTGGNLNVTFEWIETKTITP